MSVEQHADGHTVSYSQTTLTELMIPAYANFGGKIHGGTLLSLMDKVACACATKAVVPPLMLESVVDEETRAFLANERCEIRLEG